MRINPGIRLTGDRNECPGCGELFKSTAAFDKHRTGKFGKPADRAGRRCRTVAEMQRAGMARNAAGFWVTERLPADAIPTRGANARGDFSDEVNGGQPPSLENA
jgi:hypothetical protein